MGVVCEREDTFKQYPIELPEHHDSCTYVLISGLTIYVSNVFPRRTIIRGLNYSISTY
jgi:hypothetical protein